MEAQGEHCQALAKVLEARARGDEEQLQTALRALHKLFTERAGGDWKIRGMQQDAGECLGLLLDKIQRESLGQLDLVAVQFKDQAGTVCIK
jgi:hypothetical protein